MIKIYPKTLCLNVWFNASTNIYKLLFKKFLIKNNSETKKKYELNRFKKNNKFLTHKFFKYKCGKSCDYACNQQNLFNIFEFFMLQLY